MIQETVTCPFCSYEKECHILDFDECAWEERSEGRKTILNSMKPRTYKPIIASLLLITVVIIGFSSAIFPEVYLQTPLDILFAAGFTGTITITIQNQSGIPLENMYIWVDSLSKNMTNAKGTITIDKVPLGKQQIHVSSTLNSSGELIPFFFLPIQSLYTITVINHSDNLRIIDKSTNLVWCSGIVLLLSFVCMFGFIAAWKRQYFDVAIVGSIIGIGIIGFYFIGTILSVIVLVLLLKSKEEFEDGKKGKNF